MRKGKILFSTAKHQLMQKKTLKFLRIKLDVSYFKSHNPRAKKLDQKVSPFHESVWKTLLQMYQAFLYKFQ